MMPDAGRSQRTFHRLAYAAIGAAGMLLAWVSPAQEGAAAKPTFTSSEIIIILSHGPWPAPAPHDPTNRASGKPDAIEFGTRLFFDERLSSKPVAPGRRRAVRVTGHCKARLEQMQKIIKDAGMTLQ